MNPVHTITSVQLTITFATGMVWKECCFVAIQSINKRPICNCVSYLVNENTELCLIYFTIWYFTFCNICNKLIT